MANYTQENGLNCSFTYLIKQDANGFIWVGSDNGLFRFDGTEFKQYNDKNGLKNIEILSGLPLRSGEILLIPFLNDFAFIKNNVVYNSDNNAEIKKLQKRTSVVQNAYDKENDQLYIFTNMDKEIFTFKNGKVSVIPLKIDASNMKDSTDGVIFVDYKKGDVYVERYVWQPYDDVVRHSTSRFFIYNIHTHKTRPHKISTYTGEYFMDQSNNYLLSSMGNHVYVYHLEQDSGLVKKIAIDVPGKLFYVTLDPEENLWVSLRDGGVLFYEKPLIHPKGPFKPVKLLSDHIINSVFCDKDKNIWCASRNDGLFFLPKASFQHYLSLPVQQNGNYITAIAKNSTGILLGLNDLKGSIFQNNTFHEIPLAKDKIEIRAVYANDNTALFVSAINAYSADLSTLKVSIVPNTEITIGKNVVPYTKDSVLTCTRVGLKSYSLLTGKARLLFTDGAYSALPFTADSIFAGTFKDLYKVNVNNKAKTLFLSDCYFTDLKKISNNLFIGATSVKGLLLFDNKKILRPITDKDGLPTNQVKRLEIENDHTFWASTNSGLARIEITTAGIKVNTFTHIDGLPSDIVAGCVIKNDSIYVGTSKGLGVFHIPELLSQTGAIDKKAIINSITIGNKEYYDLNDHFSASYPENDVAFNLSFLDYTSMGKISYQYQIEGLSKNWQVSNSSRIILNALPPGKYVFKVYGLGYNGKRSTEYTSLAFEIKPRFWQTWWFQGLLALLLCGLIIFFITNRLQKRRNAKLQSVIYEKKIAELELQAIKAQINPHFIYNCLNSIQFLLYKKDYAETENYLGLFSKMIRKTLHYSERTFLPIREEIEYLSLYLEMEKLRFRHHLAYEITVAKNVNEEWKIPSLLIQPFLENAVKHGVSGLNNDSGFVSVTFGYQKPLLSIAIADNGKGMPDKALLNKKIDSFGLKLSRKRIETFRQLFNTDIRFEINDLKETGGQGTEVKIYLNHGQEDTSQHN